MNKMEDKYIYIGLVYLSHREGFNPCNKIMICKVKIIDEVMYKGSMQYHLEKPFPLTSSNKIRYLFERDLDSKQLLINIRENYESFYFSFDENKVKEFIEIEIKNQKELCEYQIDKYTQRYNALDSYDYTIKELSNNEFDVF